MLLYNTSLNCILKKNALVLTSSSHEKRWMKPKKRQKLCYNCEGEIDLDVIFCPYCGSDLLEEKGQQRVERSEGVQQKESDHQLYPPPYSPQKTFTLEEEMEAPADESEKETEPLTKSPRHSFWPTVLLTLGIQSLIIGILLFVFSENGAVHLRFDAKTWLFYLLFSMPLLYFGWKKLSELEP